MSAKPTTNLSATVESWTTRRLLAWIRTHLEAHEVDSPRVCAELLVAHVFKCERLRLYMDADRVATESERMTLRGLVKRASEHEPVQFLVGSWPFHGRTFEVDSSTLIPRPATETLLELALEEVARRGHDTYWSLLDLCTGSGCIAVSLLASIEALRAGRVSHRGVVDEDTPESPPPAPSAKAARLGCVASDIVADAVELARRNAERHGVIETIDLRQGDLFSVLRQDEQHSFDVICANPPYISDSEFEALDRNVRAYEPATALRGGPDGLHFILLILEAASTWLRPGGLLLMELADTSATEVAKRAEATSGLTEIRLINDHESLPRVLCARAHSSMTSAL